MEKSSEVHRRNNNGPKTLPCSTPDTTLTRLLRQPSTITCCDRFDRNCQTVKQDITSNTHRAELIENAQLVDPIKSFTEVNLHDPSLLPTLQCTLQCTGHTQKCITDTQTFPISKLISWKDTLRSINRPRRTDTRRSNTLNNTYVMEIGR